MNIFLIILSGLLWVGAGVSLFGRQILSAPLSYIALLLLSFLKSNGYSVLPINTTILTGWLCMTLVVTLAVWLQSEPMRAQTRGMGYILGGGVAGLAVGLLGNSITTEPGMLYSIMVIAMIAGIFFGFFIYTRTPQGKPVALQSGNFFKYLLAKGFPTAITLMQAGIVLVLLIALNNVHAL